MQNVKTKNGKFLNPKLEMKTLNLIQHEYMMFKNPNGWILILLKPLWLYTVMYEDNIGIC